MRRILKRLLPLWIYAAALITQSVHAEYNVPSKMDWWYNDRFGMFIHFGSYSGYGYGEWQMWSGWWSKQDYQTQISQNFNPNKFNAQQIVSLAKNAGMKYIVITAKHHEGLAMWDTNVHGFTDYTGTTDYDLFDYTAYTGVDILGALKAECDAQGLKFCLYYSILDWNHPSQVMSNTGAWPEGWFSTMQGNKRTWKTTKANYIADMKAQLAELITAYDPAILWFDGDWCANSPTTADQWWNSSDGQDLYDYLIGLKPDLIINERVKRDMDMGDYSVAEFGIPGAPLARAWERCETMNGAWGYDQSLENNYFSTADMIQKLVTCISRDGNYLLNIGPKGDGTVTAGSVAILQGIGSWMSTYSDSIYGTIGSPFDTDPWWGKFTSKSGTLYAHVFTWPENGQLAVPGLTNAITRIYSLDAPAVDLSYTVANHTITISVPPTAPDAVDSVIAIEVNGKPVADPAYAPGGAVADGTYYITNVNSGEPIVVAQGSLNNGAYIIQWPDNGNPEFRWQLTAVGGGYYTIINDNSGKAMGIEGVSTADGANALQWDYVGNTDQHWQIIDQGNSQYALFNGNSGKALDIAGASTADGASVVQWTFSGAASQLFYLDNINGGGNNPPVFSTDPITSSAATEGSSYSDTIAGSASDPDSDPLTYSSVGGPSWLNVASSGTLSGTPGASDVGANSWTVQVSDGLGGTDTATLNITVNPAGPVTDIYISNIGMSSAAYGGGRYSGIATITVKNDSGAVVPNATVSASWSGATSESASGTTDGSGVVVFESSKVRNGGTYTVTVTDVTASGYSYNSGLNVETSDSVTAP